MSRAGLEPATPCLKVRPWQHILLVLRGSGPAELASVHLIRGKLFTKLFTRERDAAFGTSTFRHHCQMR
jgi:hypothetical protein